jgi:predicted DNA-binding antitoxin AbrB/MazE fold protein
MNRQIDAVFEHGVLRPLQPLHLAERAKVKVMVSESENETWMDVEFMDSCATDSDPAIRLENVRAALAKIGGSMDSAIDVTRGEW